MRSWIVSLVGCAATARKATTSRSQQSIAKTTWTRSPDQQRISKLSEHHRVLLRRVVLAVALDAVAEAAARPTG